MSNVRILSFRRVDEMDRVAALAEVVVSVGDGDVVLRGIAVIRSGSRVRVSFPSYRHQSMAEATRAHEPRGALRNAIETAVLNRWTEISSELPVATTKLIVGDAPLSSRCRI